jgi:hypothetical protein
MSRRLWVAASLLCVLASLANAAPTLIITSSRTSFAPNSVRIWNVAATPDFSVATSAGFALEVGFQATGGNILSISAAPNMATATAPGPARVLHDDNAGNPIFGWESLTDVDPGDGVNMQAVGIQLGTGTNANEAVAYIGTNMFPLSLGVNRSEDLITITTDTSVTSLAWGGRYNADGSLATLTGSLPGFGVINQGDGTPIGGTNYAIYAGSLVAPTQITQRFVGDTNGEGRINGFDVAPFASAIYSEASYKSAQFPNLNFLRADINGSGTVNNFDVAPFGSLLQNIRGDTGSAVPEPGCMSLIGVALAGLACRSRLKCVPGGVD